MDSIRATILWQGAQGKFKYHVAKWEMIGRPKDQASFGRFYKSLMLSGLN